eukprot:3671459-Lingulodinium_polyedra.AAC.1
MRADPIFQGFVGGLAERNYPRQGAAALGHCATAFCRPSGQLRPEVAQFERGWFVQQHPGGAARRGRR